MTILRAIAPAAILSALAVGTAYPASADAPPMTGQYDATFTAEGNANHVQYFFSPCGAGCENVNVTRPGMPEGLQAHLVGGQWSVSNPHDSAACPSGEKPTPGIFSSNMTWDPNTLQGTATHTLNQPACGMPAGGSLAEQTVSFRHV